MSGFNLNGDTSGTLSVQAPAVAGTNTVTFPAATGTLALTSQLGGLTLLGTIATTSGTSVSLTGLNLTGYKQIQCQFNGTSGSSTGSKITINSVDISNNGTGNVYGTMLIDLTTSYFTATTVLTGSSGSVNIGNSGLTTSSTSIIFGMSAGNFDNGSILVYGVA